MFQAKISNICRLEGRSNSNRLHHFGLWQIVINSSDFTLDRRIVKISIRLINLKNVKKKKKIRLQNQTEAVNLYQMNNRAFDILPEKKKKKLIHSQNCCKLFLIK